jgi:hypothetical protein
MAMSGGNGQNSEDMNGAPAEAKAANLAESALTDQGDLDKLIATGRLDMAPAAALRQMAGWDGLTEKEEEDARLLNSRQQALAEYEREMTEVRTRADRLMERLDEQERETRKRLAEADSRAIVLHDGRRVLVGGRDGEYIDEADGRKLEGADRQEAQDLRQPNSETAAEQKAHKDRLMMIRDAKDHVRTAQELSQQDGKDLSPQEIKDREAQAAKELAVAEAKAKGVPDLDTGVDTDMAAALGLAGPQSGRTASFAGTMEQKDGKAVDLQNQFAGSAEGASVQTIKTADTVPSATVRPAQPTQ